MKAVAIENLKSFTTHLFVRETFNGFLTTEASFSTSTDFTIDGHINRDYLSEEELLLSENKEGIVFWKRIRPLCYEIIKGKKVPLRFKIVFMLSSGAVRKFLQSADLAFDPEQINALFLNVNYQEGKLVCTTGISLKTFSLDKSVENAWDAYAEKFLNQVQNV